MSATQVKEELITMLVYLLKKCRHEVGNAQEQMNWAEDRERAVQLVLDMLRKEAK